MNNFLLLQENDEEAFNASPKNDRVFNQLESEMSLLRFFGSVLNLYLPVMADTVMNVTGGGSISTTANTLPPAKKNKSNTEPKGPLGPDTLDSDSIR